MATISKTPSNTWKALIRKRGWPTAVKTFRTKRDAQDWERRTEDEMVRDVYIDRADASQLLLKTALDRYLQDVSSSKKPSTHAAEQHKAKSLKANLGDCSLAALNPNLIARYRDQRLADGKSASRQILCDWNSPCSHTCSPLQSRSGNWGWSTTR